MYSNVVFVTKNQFTFDVVASEDIDVWEELTSNYFLFDYTADGHRFQCACGVDGGHCYENIHGFQSLSKVDKLAMLNSVTETVLHLYCEENFDFKYIHDTYAAAEYRECFKSFATSGEAISQANNHNVFRSELEQESFQRITSYTSVPVEILYAAAFAVLFDKIRGSCALYHIRSRNKDAIYLNTRGSQATIRVKFTS